MSEKDELFQQKYMELQLLTQQMQQLKKQMQLMDQQMNELSDAMEHIDVIKESSQDELLVPITSGVFVKAKLSEKETAVVAIGNDVAVTKTLDETKDFLEKHIVELSAYKEQMTTMLTRCNDEQQKMHATLMKLQEDV